MEELTTAMHAEFTISQETERKHTAWAAFGMLKIGMALSDVLDILEIRMSDLRPFVARWNELSKTKINLE